MKLVLIVYNEAIDDEVMEQLDAAGVDGYTKWTDVLGKGRRSGPHLLSHVWPKGNNVLLTVVADDVASRLLAELRHLRETMGKEGVKAFAVNVEEVT